MMRRTENVYNTYIKFGQYLDDIDDDNNTKNINACIKIITENKDKPLIMYLHLLVLNYECKQLQEYFDIHHKEYSWMSIIGYNKISIDDTASNNYFTDKISHLIFMIEKNEGYCYIHNDISLLMYSTNDMCNIMPKLLTNFIDIESFEDAFENLINHNGEYFKFDCLYRFLDDNKSYMNYRIFKYDDRYAIVDLTYDVKVLLFNSGGYKHFSNSNLYKDLYYTNDVNFSKKVIRKIRRNWLWYKLLSKLN